MQLNAADVVHCLGLLVNLETASQLCVYKFCLIFAVFSRLYCIGVLCCCEDFLVYHFFNGILIFLNILYYCIMVCLVKVHYSCLGLIGCVCCLCIFASIITDCCDNVLTAGVLCYELDFLVHLVGNFAAADCTENELLINLERGRILFIEDRV